jgi:hypothetical protein
VIVPRGDQGPLPFVTRRIDGVPALMLAGLIAGIVLWALSLRSIDVSAMNDLGLASVLTPLTVAALLVITLTFGLTVAIRPRATWLLLLHVVALIVTIFALTALVETVPRFSVAWRHAGIIEVLTRTSRIEPSIDAYFSWPGFFALGAFLTQAAGFSSAVDMTAWAPVVFNLLYLPAVIIILRAGTADPRIVWVGAWLFFVGNWIGQDYFSPQGLDYFLYLLIVGLLLTMFRAAPIGSGRLASLFQPADEPEGPILRPFQRAALLSIVLLLFATTVYSHQLTPFAIVGVVIALVMIRRINPTGLPLVMLVLLGAWLSLMKVEYLSGHINELIARFGSVDTTVAANLTDRFRGSPLHLLVLGVRALMTIFIFSLAGVGAVDRHMRGRRDLTWPLLTVVPFGLLLVQDYGGEMLLRVYLFSLPFAAFLAAHALVGIGRADRARHALAVTAVLSILLAAFLVSRFGNERMDMATAAESQGMNQLYQLAPHDSLLVALSSNTFWKFRDYELYHYAVVSHEAQAGDVPAIVDRMQQGPGRPAYLLVTRSQLAALELQSGMTPSDLGRLVTDIEGDPKLRLVFSNQDVQIFSTTGSPTS